MKEEIGELLGIDDFKSFPSFKAIQDALAAYGAGVYVIPGKERSLALIIYSGGIEDIWLDFSYADLAKMLISDEAQKGKETFLHTVLSGVRLAESLGEILPIIGEKIAKPVAATLQGLGIQSVTFIPLQFMALFPLHAATYFVDGREMCLLDKFRVSYVPSSCFLLLSQRAGVSTQISFLGVGNPLPYDDFFSRIPFSEIEVECIKSIFPGNAKVLYREVATSKAVESELPTATHIHLACHGDFWSEYPLRSGFYLSNHSKLYSAQLFSRQNPRRAELAVLSACKTALADFESATTEITGLITAFFWAGVPRVIGTLWPIDDLSTARLMLRFYEYYFHHDPGHEVKQLSGAEALRRAQLWLRDATTSELREYVKPYVKQLDALLAQSVYNRLALEEDTISPFAHPVFWAGFVFHGS